MTGIYANASYLYSELEKYEEALEYNQKSLSLSKREGDKLSIAISYGNIGSNLSNLKRFKEAIEYLEKSITLTKALKDSSAIASYVNLLGETYMAQGKLNEAKEHLEKGLKIARKINYSSSIEYSLEKLIEVEKRLGNYKAAFKHLISWKAYNDSIFNAEKSKQISELSIQYETEKKEKALLKAQQETEIKELELLKKQLQVEQITLYGIIGFSLVFLLTLVWYFISNQKKLKLQYQAQIAEQRLSRMQMDPHFIFNVLNAIQVYMTEIDVSKARTYLIKFSRLMRQTLEFSRSELIPLEQEKELLENYLTIQNLYRNNEFNFEIIIEDIYTIDFIRIPPMFIQPFVENAIEHGISSLKGGGMISVHFSKENELIKVTIEDNGQGKVSPEKAENTGKSHHSLAYQITQERFEHLRRTMNKGAKLHVNYSNEGTKVEMWLPYKEL